MIKRGGGVLLTIINIFSTITFLIQIIAGIYIYIKFDDIKSGLISKITESLNNQIEPLKQQLINDLEEEISNKINELLPSMSMAR